MKMNEPLMAILAGTIYTSAIVVTIPQAAHSITGIEISNIAREVTVLIRSERGHGSGVIISKNNDTYYVLTNKHVVDKEGNYKVITSDKQGHQINYQTVKAFQNVDLAVLEFVSKKTYQVAELASFESAQGQQVFISGWPDPGSLDQLIRQFTGGHISGFLNESILGYEMSYTNVTRPGMSGGPVFDEGGRVIGIHGWGGQESPERLLMLGGVDALSLSRFFKIGFNYGIPIQTFLQEATGAGVFVNLRVSSAPPQKLNAPYVPSKKTDKRDIIKDVNKIIADVDKTLRTVDKAADTVDKTMGTVCRIFGC